LHSMRFRFLLFWSPLGVGFLDMFGFYCWSPQTFFDVEIFVQEIETCKYL